MMENKGEQLKSVSNLNKFKKYIIGGISAIFLLVIINASVFNVKLGQYAIQQGPGGGISVLMTPGYKLKWPFVSNVWYYDVVTTITYDSDAGAKSGNQYNTPYKISFADTYGGKISGSFRVEMPKDPDKFIELHKAFKNYANFVDNGAEKFTNELLIYTANQFTGETFMQGGQNEYKNRLEDQARNGLYVTKRTAVKVKKQAGTVGLRNDKPAETEDSLAVIYKNVIQRDDHGVPLRQANPMAKYGVTVSQVTIAGFDPEPDLKDFMSNKKQMVRKRAKLVEDQENERQSAITAKLKGDRERVEAKQEMLMQKDKAEINLAKDVEVAKLQAEKEKVDRQKLADLAIIDKKKELQMATANENIQKANERAAKYEAQAITYKGLAQAKVLKATYDARDPRLYALEKQVEITENLKDAFSGITVKMPTNMITTGGSGEANASSVNTIMQLLQLDKLNELTKDTGADNMTTVPQK